MFWSLLPVGCRGEAVAGGAGFDDVGAVGDAVDDGGCEPGVGEGPAPFREGRVAHDRYRGALLTLGQDLEEELGGSLVEVDVAEPVDLCRRRHKWTYADLVVMPMRRDAVGVNAPRCNGFVSPFSICWLA